MRQSFYNLPFGIMAISTIVLLSSCTHHRPQTDTPQPLASSSGSNSSQMTGQELSSSGSLVPEEVEKVSTSETSASTEGAHVPIEVNEAVLDWIDYFKGRGRHHMVRYLQRSTRYLPMMRQVFREEGLPEDLVYIALIESGFNPVARSHANAVGYWQFIRGTGKHYGLQINSLIDERRDPVLATRAAATYLRALYNLFGNWYLAIISYNVGENRVKSVVMKYQTRDFWEMARRRKLPRETIEYLPKFFAATLIARHPEKYGFTDLEYEPPLAFETYKLTKPVNMRKLAAALEVDYDDFRRMNPKFKTDAMPVPGFDQEIRIPVGKSQQVAAVIDSAEISMREVASMEEQGFQYYKIRRGDNLSSIAKRFRTTVANLREINNLGRKSMLRAGRKIRVPDREEASVRSRSSQQRSAKSQNFAQKSRRVASIERSNERSTSKGKKIHIVRRGDTLTAISSRYRVPVHRIVKVNRLKSSSKLLAGATIFIPE